MRVMEKENFGQNQREAVRRWIWLAIFAIGFAWVESSIVVYLREIFYGGVFKFPLLVHWEKGEYVGNYLTRIELIREAATILMLAAIGCVAGKNRLQRLSFFMIAFGIWDIFYYIWLFVMIRWPESLLTWDILFLLPLPWVGPVITPVLIALAMSVAGTLIIYYNERGFDIRFSWYDWLIELGCAFLLIVAFCWDWKNIIQLPDGSGYSGIPNPFLWGLFLPAYLFSVAYFGIRLRQILSKQK